MITGKYIKELREAAGLSQIELAKLAGISQAHIAKIENEKVDPRLSTINTILSVLLKRGKEGKKILCKDIMSKNIVHLKPEDGVKRAIKLMKSLAISQLPVFEHRKQVGSISEATIMKNLDKNLSFFKVEDIMDHEFPTVNAYDTIDILPDLLDFHAAVLVSDKGKIVGIITKSDLLGVK